MDFNGIGYLQGFPEFTDKGNPVCSETDPDLFFPVDALDGTMTYREHYTNEQEVKKLCSTCPYKFECLAYAIKDLDIQGIWGGTTQVERRRLTRSIRTHQKAREML